MNSSEEKTGQTTGGVIPILRIDCEYPLPEGLPRTPQGLPVYPDPSIYPSHIIAGFNGWVEITAAQGIVTYRWINPADPKYVQFPTLRRGDTRASVIDLLGAPLGFEETFDDKYLAENYSHQVSIIYDAHALSIDCFNTRRGLYMSVDVWEFVFVDPDLLNKRA